MAAEDSITKIDERFTANMFAVATTVFMIICEAEAIEGMWLRAAQRHYGLERYFLPIAIAFPVLSLFAFRTRLRRWVADGVISSRIAAQIINGVGSLVMVAYLCIFAFAELALRAR